MEQAIAEFPFVERLPKREKSRLGKLWDAFSQFKALTEKHGTIIPIPLAAEMAGVSRQCIENYVARGRLAAVELNGRFYVLEDSFIEYAKSERKPGRPLKSPSMATCLAVGREISGQ